MGIFIQITTNAEQISPELAGRLVSVCPVDIYGREGERVTVKPDREDECTLCRLCLDIAPPGAITIHKLYSGETLVSDPARKK